VPPWINKFYVLDLRPENSFIKWAVDQGHTVFVISWVNPDERLAHKGFEDYMLEGPLAALDVVGAAAGEREVNAIGYCLGGTLLAATLAYLTAQKDDRIQTATYLVTLVDFTDVGDMAVFIDEEQLAVLEKRMRSRGYLEAHNMAIAFNMLRANDLIWSFVVSNYLLGKQPIPFDLLYWNADSTRMPAAMHSFYLRKMYHENRLAIPGGISFAGVAIDLAQIKTPGVISPPGSRYGHWQNPNLPKSPAEWFETANLVQTSWWPTWEEWVSWHAGGWVKAREPGGLLQPIEDAPGSYVRVRAVN
jgi:polyhydroxyalkanoate synthase